MANQIKQISPNIYARTGGFLYLIMIILGFINVMVIRGNIIVPGNVSATSANLKSMENLWRLGIFIEFVMGGITIWLAMILYYLTKPVEKNLAQLALFFNLVAITVGIVAALRLIEALFPLESSEFLKAFTTDQLNGLANMAIKSQSLGFGISLLLFGPFFFLTGYLIIKSGYIPKAIGILYFIPGLSYTMSSLALILAPDFANHYYFMIAGPAVIGELSLCLWLIIKGVNITRWNEKIIAL